MTKTRTSAPGRGRSRLPREEGGNIRDRKLEHESVMVGEVLAALAPKKGEVVVDATYGVGGHSTAIKKKAHVTLIALDADPASGGTPPVLEANFADLGEVLERLGVKEVNKVLFDLGWNRTQLASGRGFSFMRDEPLVMSYGAKPRSGFSAAQILNEWSEKVLADVFFGYGEERYARRIANAVVERRELRPFATTLELVELVRDAVPAAYRHGRINPATKTFQALRIAVNDELSVLDKGLRAAWKHLACGGRIVVLTFHSIEDRAVKRLFLEFAGHGGTLVYKKPLTPSATEVRRNAAARSAKLRAIEKTCTP